MKPEPNELQLDLPPEYCHYHDEGCEISRSCLDCVLPVCIYELPGGRRRWLIIQRNREIARKHSYEGKGVKELALSFGVSQRTVQRVLKSFSLSLTIQSSQQSGKEG